MPFVTVLNSCYLDYLDTVRAFSVFPAQLIANMHLDANSEADIELNEEVVIMSTKGEAIAIGIAQMTTVELATCDHGVVAKVKRCIMDVSQDGNR